MDTRVKPAYHTECAVLLHSNKEMVRCATARRTE
jgi:hypothetical protein